MIPRKFKGTFDELQALVEQTGILGEWESDGVKRTFRTWKKGILNWWESTGTIDFQGKAAARAAFENEFNEAMAKYVETSKRATSEEADDDDDDLDDLVDDDDDLDDLVDDDDDLDDLVDDDDNLDFDDDYLDEGEKNVRLIRPGHRRQDDICDDSDPPWHSSSRPEDGGDLLLNLVKEALVKYGFAVKATGPSTFIVKRTG